MIYTVAPCAWSQAMHVKIIRVFYKPKPLHESLICEYYTIQNIMNMFPPKHTHAHMPTGYDVNKSQACLRSDPY